MKRILLNLYQLPQILCAWVFRLIMRAKNNGGAPTLYRVDGMGGAVTLGESIFVGGAMATAIAEYERDVDYHYNSTYWHEYGHVLQSRKLGWLYLFVIGIPSICWAGIHTLLRLEPRKYYDFYTEKWADRLGGVTRE